MTATATQAMLLVLSVPAGPVIAKLAMNLAFPIKFWSERRMHSRNAEIVAMYDRQH